jgi:hypothetical protein
LTQSAVDLLLQGHHVKITVPLLAHKSSELRLYLRNKQTAASLKLQSVQDSASLLQRTKSIQPEPYTMSKIMPVQPVAVNKIYLLSRLTARNQTTNKIN